VGYSFRERPLAWTLLYATLIVSAAALVGFAIFDPRQLNRVMLLGLGVTAGCLIRTTRRITSWERGFGWVLVQLVGFCALLYGLKLTILGGVGCWYGLRTSDPSTGLFAAWIALSLALSAVGAWLFRFAGRRVTTIMGYCAACDYDLTGNTSGVCPECGTPSGGERRAAPPAARNNGGLP
jgi:hypothetical protein